MDIQLEENGIWVEKTPIDGSYENEKAELEKTCKKYCVNCVNTKVIECEFG